MLGGQNPQRSPVRPERCAAPPARSRVVFMLCYPLCPTESVMIARNNMRFHPGTIVLVAFLRKVTGASNNISAPPLSIPADGGLYVS